MATISVTQTAVVQLKPTVKARLLARLRSYGAIQQQIKGLQAQLDEATSHIASLRVEADIQGTLEIDGYKITEVTGTRSVLSKERLLALGVTMAMLEQATEIKPNRPYLRITLPERKGLDHA